MALNITTQGAFASPFKQQRAAHLIHHLGTGAPLPVLDDLALPNLLCGLAPAHPTLPAEALTQDEADLSLSLLTAVCGAWPGLENTSAQGLRDTFLIRPGLLELTGEGPHRLRLEPRPFDMLLNRVPWPTGMVSLAWMDRPLAVDWGRA